MREISSEDFWIQVLQASVFTEKELEVLRDFLLAPLEYVTIADVDGFIGDTILPKLEASLEQNNCNGSKSVTKHLQASLQESIMILDNRADWLLEDEEPPCTIYQVYRQKIAALNHEADNKGLCHFTAKGLKCYCTDRSAQ